MLLVGRLRALTNSYKRVLIKISLDILISDSITKQSKYFSFYYHKQEDFPSFVLNILSHINYTNFNAKILSISQNSTSITPKTTQIQSNSQEESKTQEASKEREEGYQSRSQERRQERSEERDPNPQPTLFLVTEDFQTQSHSPKEAIPQEASSQVSSQDQLNRSTDSSQSFESLFLEESSEEAYTQEASSQENSQGLNIDERSLQHNQPKFRRIRKTIGTSLSSNTRPIKYQRKVRYW
jgi:flagellar biosynthesis GTPase FlhF